MEKDLTTVPTTGLVPNVKNLRVTLQATGKTSIKPSKKGRRQAIVPLEIIAPADPIKDLDGNTVVVAGLQVNMYIQLDDKGLQQGTAELHKKAKLPLQFDPDSDEACMSIYNNMCIDAILTSEEQQLTQYDENTGGQVPARDAEGNVLKGQFQWKLLSVSNIIGPGKRIDDFTTTA